MPFPLSLFRELDKEIFETQRECMGVDPLKLFGRQETVQVRVLMPDNGMVLGHETQGQPAPEFNKEGRQCVKRIAYFSRKNQMPDKDALPCRS